MKSPRRQSGVHSGLDLRKRRGISAGTSWAWSGAIVAALLAVIVTAVAIGG